MGKAIRDEDLRLNIIVNGDESQKRIGDLSRQTRDLANANFELRQEQRRLKAEGKENTELYRQNAAEIKKMLRSSSPTKSKCSSFAPR